MGKIIIILVIITCVYCVAFSVYLKSDLVYLWRVDMGYVFVKDESNIQSGLIFVFKPALMVYTHMRGVRLVHTSEIEE